MTDRNVERTIAIDAPVAAVWSALTDARELVRWFPLAADVDRERGTIRLAWGDAYDATGAIEAWEEGRHLRHRFPVVGEVQLATDYFVEGDGDRTVLRVVSSGFGADEDWDEAYEGVARGWDFELSSLRHYLERHRGEDRSVLLRVLGFEGPDAAAWQAVAGPGGLFTGGLVVNAGVWRGTAPNGAALSGAVVSNQPPRQFAGHVAEWNDGLFRIEIERDQGPARIWVQLSTWAIDAAALERLGAAWDDVLRERIAASAGSRA